jgi:hypothetical protein
VLLLPFTWNSSEPETVTTATRSHALLRTAPPVMLAAPADPARSQRAARRAPAAQTEPFALFIESTARSN